MMIIILVVVVAVVVVVIIVVDIIKQVNDQSSNHHCCRRILDHSQNFYQKSLDQRMNQRLRRLKCMILRDKNRFD